MHDRKIQFSNVEIGKIFKIDGSYREVVRFEHGVAMLHCRYIPGVPVTSIDVCVCDFDAKKNWHFLPPSESWGEKGFTYNNHDIADSVFNSLVQAQNKN